MFQTDKKLPEKNYCIVHPDLQRSEVIFQSFNLIINLIHIFSRFLADQFVNLLYPPITHCNIMTKLLIFVPYYLHIL